MARPSVEAARALAEAYIADEQAKAEAAASSKRLAEAERMWERHFEHNPVTVRLHDGTLVTIREAARGFEYIVSREVAE